MLSLTETKNDLTTKDICDKLDILIDYSKSSTEYRFQISNLRDQLFKLQVENESLKKQYADLYELMKGKS